MKTYHGIATIIYHQDPITGFKAYCLEPVDIPATLVLNELGHWSIIFDFSFDNCNEKGGTIELGLTMPYSSNPKIFIQHERWPINISDLPSKFNLTFFEQKGNREAPWAYHRIFSMEFISSKNSISPREETP